MDNIVPNFGAGTVTGRLLQRQNDYTNVVDAIMLKSVIVEKQGGQKLVISFTGRFRYSCNSGLNVRISSLL